MSYLLRFACDGKLAKARTPFTGLRQLPLERGGTRFAPYTQSAACCGAQSKQRSMAEWRKEHDWKALSDSIGYLLNPIAG